MPQYPDQIRKLWKSDLFRLMRMIVSPTARGKFHIAPGPAPSTLVEPRHSDHRYRNPIDLRVRDVPIRRALVIGSCLAQAYADYRGFAPHFDCDFVLANFAHDLPSAPPRPIDDYDFQLVSPAYRVVVPEYGFFTIPYSDIDGYERFFAECSGRLDMVLDSLLAWNRAHKLLSFVTNFLVPQQNPMGRLLPPHDLRNPAYFVERLNEHLHRRLTDYPNAHMIDIAAIARNFGQKLIQDDHVWHQSHGSYLGDWDHEVDGGRIEPTYPASHFYPLKTSLFFKAVWEEIGGAYRIIHQIDPVKMVVVDLDDTLWRGVMAEDALSHAEPLEGWPLGVIDALATLRKRGLLLAILSKNEEAKVEALWPDVLRPIFALSAFASRRINWRPKAENMAELLKETNLLPKNVVFIDDNPVERAAMKAAWPDIRVLGDHPYLLRRILLWAPETQVPAISAESDRRTDMIQAQIVRDTARSSMTRETFLAELDVRITPTTIRDVRHAQFARALELLNKTNQFNTTGARWTMERLADLFDRGGHLATFAVADKFSAYGTVVVAIVAPGQIVQMVMSCRVIGLGVEQAALAWIVGTMRPDGDIRLTAPLIETKDNLPARDLYPQAGFTQQGDLWVLDGTGPAMPAHIRVEGDAKAAAIA